MNERFTTAMDTVEAIQWTGENPIEVEEFLSRASSKYSVYPSNGTVMIHHDGSNLLAKRSDWIVRDRFKDYRVIKNSFFHLNHVPFGEHHAADR